MSTIQTITKAGATAVGARVLDEHFKREQLIEELETRADAYQAKADAQPYAVSEVKSFYKAKAAEARQRARELRGEVAKEHTETSKAISFKLGERVAR